jgi:hypothetical protein
MKLPVALLTLALGIASAKSYTVNLFQPAYLAGTELRSGEYKLEVLGNKVSFKNGSTAIEAAVTVENLPAENPRTTMRIDTTDGKNQIKEIRLGGTTMKLVVN